MDDGILCGIVASNDSREIGGRISNFFFDVRGSMFE
jgi:hypothetical protein